MTQRVCPQCGAPIDPNATECKFCGEKLVMQQQQTQQFQQQPQGQPQINVQIQQPQQPQQIYVGVNPSWPVKSKTVAGLLAIFLGGIGIHKFYLGQTGKGVLYLVFCWTCVPAIIAFFSGISMLVSNKENFELKYHVRCSD